ncbi:hypothetical protein BJ912DRAFT_1058647 [Pholiota molesta]|nr:hypothetical protein BJ912DRAFT_1058647 [Pholiota molesta]
MLVKKHVRSGTINEIAEHAMSEFVDVFKLERAKHPELLPVFEEPRFYTVKALGKLWTNGSSSIRPPNGFTDRPPWQVARGARYTRQDTCPPGGLVERGNIKIAGGGVRRPRESPGPARPRKKKDAAAAQPPATSVAPEAPSNPTTSKGPPPTLKVAAATQAQSKPTTSKAPATKLKVPLATEPEAPVRPTTSAAPATKGKLPPATKAAKPPAMEAAMTVQPAKSGRSAKPVSKAPIGPAIPHPKGNKHHGIRPPTDEMSRLSVGNIPQSPPRLKALDDMDTEDDSARPPITEEEADELPDKGGEGGKSAKRKRKATPKDAGDHPPKKQKNEEESDTDDDSNVKPQQVDAKGKSECTQEGAGKKRRLEQKATAESTKKPTSTVATKAPKKKSKEAHAPAKSEQKTDDAAKAPVQQKPQSKSIDANQAVVQAKPQSTAQSITVVHTGKAGDGDDPHSKPADADPALVQAKPDTTGVQTRETGDDHEQQPNGQTGVAGEAHEQADGVSPADDRTEAHEENKADYNKDATENEDADDEEELDNEMEVDNVQAAGPQHRLIKTVYGKPRSQAGPSTDMNHAAPVTLAAADNTHESGNDDETGIPRYPVKIEASDIEVPKVSKQKKGKSKATADDEEPDVEDEGFEFVDMDGPVTMQEYLSHLKNCRDRFEELGQTSKHLRDQTDDAITQLRTRWKQNEADCAQLHTLYRAIPGRLNTLISRAMDLPHMFNMLRWNQTRDRILNDALFQYVGEMESKHLAEITSLTERVAGLEQALKITTAAPPTDLGAALATTMYNTFQERYPPVAIPLANAPSPEEFEDRIAKDMASPSGFADDDMDGTTYFPAQPTDHSEFRRPNTFVAIKTLVSSNYGLQAPATPPSNAMELLSNVGATHEESSLPEDSGPMEGYTIQARRLSPTEVTPSTPNDCPPTEVTPSTAGAPVQDDSLPTELTPATADAPDADDSAMTQVEPPTDNNGMDVDPQTSHWTARDTAAAGWEHSVPEAWGQQRSVDTLGPPEPPLVLLTPPTPQNSQETNAPVTELFVPTPATSSGAPSLPDSTTTISAPTLPAAPSPVSPSRSVTDCDPLSGPTSAPTPMSVLGPATESVSAPSPTSVLGPATESTANPAYGPAHTSAFIPATQSPPAPVSATLPDSVFAGLPPSPSPQPAETTSSMAPIPSSSSAQIQHLEVPQRKSRGRSPRPATRSPSPSPMRRSPRFQKRTLDEGSDMEIDAE